VLNSRKYVHSWSKGLYHHIQSTVLCKARTTPPTKKVEMMLIISLAPPMLWCLRMGVDFSSTQLSISSTWISSLPSSSKHITTSLPRLSYFERLCSNCLLIHLPICRPLLTCAWQNRIVGEAIGIGVLTTLFHRIPSDSNSDWGLLPEVRSLM